MDLELPPELASYLVELDEFIKSGGSAKCLTIGIGEAAGG